MKTLLNISIILLLYATTYGQITEQSIAKEWKVTEVISLTPPPGTKSPERDKQVKEMFLKGSFSLKKDHSFSSNLGDFSSTGVWILHSKTGEVEVVEKDSTKKVPELLISFIVKFLSPTKAIFTFPDGDIVMFTLGVEAR